MSAATHVSMPNYSQLHSSPTKLIMMTWYNALDSKINIHLEYVTDSSTLHRAALAGLPWAYISRRNHKVHKIHNDAKLLHTFTHSHHRALSEICIAFGIPQKRKHLSTAAAGRYRCRNSVKLLPHLWTIWWDAFRKFHRTKNKKNNKLLLSTVHVLRGLNEQRVTILHNYLFDNIVRFWAKRSLTEPDSTRERPVRCGARV